MAMLIAPRIPALAQHMNLSNTPCRDAVSTVDAYRCFADAAKATDAHMEDYLSRTKTVMEASEIDGLEKAQALWMQFREANCSAERALYDGGTGAAVAYQACLEEESRTRLADLQAIYGWRLEKRGSPSN
jgi:uncharacterized protein YecT (DUF1311 family)